MNSKIIISNIFCISKRIVKPSGPLTVNGKIVESHISHIQTWINPTIRKLSKNYIITGITPSESNDHRNRFYSDGNKETPITITFVLPTNVKTVDEIEKSSAISDR